MNCLLCKSRTETFKFKGQPICSSCAYESVAELQEHRQREKETKEGRRDVPIFSLVKLEPQKRPVYFVLALTDYSHHGARGIGTDEFEESHRYWLEEHTCPTNFMAGEVIVNQGDLDPHGLFTYVRSVKAVEVPKSPNDEAFWCEMFPEIKDDESGQIIEGEYRDSTLKAIPLSVDLRDKMPPIIDQGELGMSTACGASSLLAYYQARVDNEGGQ